VRQIVEWGELTISDIERLVKEVSKVRGAVDFLDVTAKTLTDVHTTALYDQPASQLVAAPFNGGHDFQVNRDMVIYEGGIYDNLGSGLLSAHEWQIWDTLTQTKLASIQFNPGDGTLRNGYRYKPLDPPLRVNAGTFISCTADFGAGNLDYDGNNGNGDPQPHINTRNGVVQCVGGSRYGPGIGFPTIHDTGPSARYHWASFAFAEYQVAMDDAYTYNSQTKVKDMEVQTWILGAPAPIVGAAPYTLVGSIFLGNLFTFVAGDKVSIRAVCPFETLVGVGNDPGYFMIQNTTDGTILSRGSSVITNLGEYDTVTLDLTVDVAPAGLVLPGANKQFDLFANTAIGSTIQMLAGGVFGDTNLSGFAVDYT
jgi:hypothetical protein